MTLVEKTMTEIFIWTFLPLCKCLTAVMLHTGETVEGICKFPCRIPFTGIIISLIFEVACQKFCFWKVYILILLKSLLRGLSVWDHVFLCHLVPELVLYFLSMVLFNWWWKALNGGTLCVPMYLLEALFNIQPHKNYYLQGYSISFQYHFLCTVHTISEWRISCQWFILFKLLHIFR